MKNWFKSLFGNPGVTLVAKTDHIELTSAHLVVGLQLCWHNKTAHPIAVKEIQMKAYLHDRKNEPVSFYPLERFARVETQRGLQKSPIRPFTLAVGEDHIEQIRFISQEVLDIAEGSYPSTILLIDTSDIGHECQTTLRVRTELKYRSSEEWPEEEN